MSTPYGAMRSGGSKLQASKGWLERLLCAKLKAFWGQLGHLPTHGEPCSTNWAHLLGVRGPVRGLLASNIGSSE